MAAPNGPAPDVITVREYAVAALLGGSFGWFMLPKGGKVAVQHLTRSDTYRLTIDVRAGQPLATHEDGAAFNHETHARLASGRAA